MAKLSESKFPYKSCVVAAFALLLNSGVIVPFLVSKMFSSQLLLAIYSEMILKNCLIPKM